MNHEICKARTSISSFTEIIVADECWDIKRPIIVVIGTWAVKILHMLLPYAVKTLTGNTELIRTLNKFGHSVSYSQLEENETALCLQKLATGLNQRVALPAFIKPYVFTNLAWDNIDRLEETLSGKGTSH